MVKFLYEEGTEVTVGTVVALMAPADASDDDVAAALQPTSRPRPDPPWAMTCDRSAARHVPEGYEDVPFTAVRLRPRRRAIARNLEAAAASPASPRTCRWT